MAAKWKEPPRDALDTMVLKTGLKLPQDGDLERDPIGIKNREELDRFEQIEFVPFDPRTKRTEGKLRGPDGKVFNITKVGKIKILRRIFKIFLHFDVDRTIQIRSRYSWIIY